MTKGPPRDELCQDVAMATPRKLFWVGRGCGRRPCRAAAVVCAVCTLAVATGGPSVSAQPLARPVAQVAAQREAKYLEAGATPAASGASVPKTKAGSQLAWLLQAMSHLPVPVAQVDEHFDAAYLSQTPPAQVNAQLEKLGPVTLQSVVTSQRVGLSGVVETKIGTAYTIDLLVDVNGRIRALLFQSYLRSSTSWAEVDKAVTSVAPKVGLFVGSVTGNSCTPLHTLNAATPMPLGSASDLYVLDALGQAIAKGKISWIQRVTVTAGTRSLPPGALQDLPNGSGSTVLSVASKMISLGDNTATDMLVTLVGRNAVEAAVKGSGAAHPELNQPFLTTRELFALKADNWPKLAQRYLALPAAKRLAFLRTVDGVPLSAIRKGASSWTKPRDVSSLGWFGSAEDVCHVFAHLSSLARQAKVAPISPMLAANGGGLALNSSQWTSVWFKGSSEPGVLTLSYLATTTKGQSYVVSVLAENASHTIGPTATGTLIGAIRGAFQLAAR